MVSGKCKLFSMVTNLVGTVRIGLVNLKSGGMTIFGRC